VKPFFAPDNTGFLELTAYLGEINCEEIAVSYVRKKETVAVIAPYFHYTPSTERKLGAMEGRGAFKVKGDFKMTREELLGSK